MLFSQDRIEIVRQRKRKIVRRSSLHTQRVVSGALERFCIASQVITVHISFNYHLDFA